jgi:hypothetical protein
MVKPPLSMVGNRPAHRYRCVTAVVESHLQRCDHPRAQVTPVAPNCGAAVSIKYRIYHLYMKHIKTYIIHSFCDIFHQPENDEDEDDDDDGGAGGGDMLSFNYHSSNSSI